MSGRSRLVLEHDIDISISANIIPGLISQAPYHASSRATPRTPVHPQAHPPLKIRYLPHSFIANSFDICVFSLVAHRVLPEVGCSERHHLHRPRHFNLRQHHLVALLAGLLRQAASVGVLLRGVLRLRLPNARQPRWTTGERNSNC